MLAIFRKSSLFYVTHTMTFIATDFSGARFGLAPNLALINIATAIGLLLVAVWFICIWLFGLNVMTIVILACMGANLIGAIMLKFMSDGYPWPSAEDLPLVRTLSGSPWYFHALLLLVALSAYWALMSLGARVKKMSEVGA